MGRVVANASLRGSDWRGNSAKVSRVDNGVPDAERAIF
jgi:hypothetical protein